MQKILILVELSFVDWYNFVYFLCARFLSFSIYEVSVSIYTGSNCKKTLMIFFPYNFQNTFEPLTDFFFSLQKRAVVILDVTSLKYFEFRTVWVCTFE